MDTKEILKELKGYGISSSDIANWMGYSSVGVFHSTSAKGRVLKGILEAVRAGVIVGKKMGVEDMVSLISRGSVGNG